MKKLFYVSACIAVIALCFVSCNVGNCGKSCSSNDSDSVVVDSVDTVDTVDTFDIVSVDTVCLN